MQFGKDRREILALISDAKRKSLAHKAAIQWETLLPDVVDVLKAAGERWNEAFAPLIAGVVTDAAEHWHAEAGLAFDVRNLEAEAYLLEQVATFSSNISATGEREIAAILQRGQADGFTVAQMQKAIELLFKQWISGDVEADDVTFAMDRLPPYRIENIARTQTMQAYNAGSFEIYRTNNVAEKEWLAALDNHTRDSHAEANGQVVGIDEMFNVGGVEMEYPGDPSAPVEEIAQCRCAVLPAGLEE